MAKAVKTKKTAAAQVPAKYTEEFRHWCKQTGRGVLEMARVAAAVRDECGYKSYVEWLASEFGVSRQTGDRLLLVHKNLLSTPNLGVTGLDGVAPSAIYLLASNKTPEKVRDKFVEQARKGEPVTHAKVREAVKAATATDKPKGKANDDDAKAAEPVKVEARRVEPPPPDNGGGDNGLPTEDERGNKLVRSEHRQAFAGRREIEAHMRAVSAVKCAVLTAIRAGNPAYAFAGAAEVEEAFGAAYSRLRFALPHALCPAHADDETARAHCRWCDGHGWVTERRYRLHAEETAALAAARSGRGVAA